MSDPRNGAVMSAVEPTPAALLGCTARLRAVLQEELHELKWAVLAVACLLTFGSYYIFDFPGSIGTGPENTIESYFRERGKAYTQSMNQMLYSVYSWPNTVLAIFGGLLIDKYLGLRRAMFLFTTLVLLGSLLFSVGVRTTNYQVMLVGRVLFGLGGESLSVSQSAFVARWFRVGRGMALAFGITISFSRVGSSFNFLFSPLIAERFGVHSAVLSGCVACCVSLASCGVLILADMYAVRTGYVKPEARDSGNANTTRSSTEAGTVVIADGERLVGDGTAQQSAAAEEAVDGLKLSDILRLPAEYWLLCIICVACYSAIFPFIGVAKNFFEVKYGYTGSQAAQYISSYQLTSAVASPVIGLVVDAAGRNTYWLIAASFSLIGVHLLFTFTTIPALVLVMAMGGFYSFLVSGLWPSIPLAVNENIVGLSYGVMTSIQNIGLASFPAVVGRILDSHTPVSEGGSMHPQVDSASSSTILSSLHASSFASCSTGGAQGSRILSFWPPSGSGSDPTSSGCMGSSSLSESGPSHGSEGSSLPSMDGYFWSEILFIGAATVSLVASVALLCVDLRGRGVLSASSEARRQTRASEEEEESLLRGLIPDNQREHLDSTF